MYFKVFNVSFNNFSFKILDRLKNDKVLNDSSNSTQGFKAEDMFVVTERTGHKLSELKKVHEYLINLTNIKSSKHKDYSAHFCTSGT